jgi:thioredoxin reductase
MVPRRNAAAVHVHNFVARDGITPSEFRRIGRQQRESYCNVEIHDLPVEEIAGVEGAFAIRLPNNTVQARRVLLCTGMVDELPDIDGFGGANMVVSSVSSSARARRWSVAGALP